MAVELASPVAALVNTSAECNNAGSRSESYQSLTTGMRNRLHTCDQVYLTANYGLATS